MTRTVVESKTRTVIIGFDQPFCVIGERINPTGRKKLAAELEAGNFDTVRKDALEQVACGAAMLDVNAGVVYNSNPNPNETEPPLLREMVRLVQSLVDVPLSIDSSVTGAIEAAMEVVEGRPLINSVTGETEKLEAILPLVKKYNVPVVAISNDETGISMDPDVRFAVARKIVHHAADYGIPAHDIVVDPLVMPIGALAEAGQQVFTLVRRLRDELGVNTTCGASNISFGLPNRHGINHAFLPMAICAGMTSAIMNPVQLPTPAAKIEERLAALRALGVSIPEGIDLAELLPLLGLGARRALPSREMEAIRGANFLMNHDPNGAEWIRFNRDPSEAKEGARGGREGRRRRA
jgi:5-methyltetrahydrofolate--homocysteine methyltransferase